MTTPPYPQQPGSQPSGSDPYGQYPAQQGPYAGDQGQQPPGGYGQDGSAAGYGQSGPAGGYADPGYYPAGEYGQAAQQGAAYGQAPSYGQAPAYGQGSDAAYYPAGGYYPTQQGAVAQPEKNSKLGYIGLGLAIAALVLGIGFAVWGGNAYAELMRVMIESGYIDPNATDVSVDTTNLPPGLEQEAATMVTAMAAQILPSILGLVGLILGAVSLGKARSKAPGIAAIIVAVLAPIACLIVFFSLMASGVQSLV